MTRLEWTETGEPYIRLDDRHRLDAFRPDDIDAWFEMRSTPDIRASSETPIMTRDTCERYINRKIAADVPVLSGLRNHERVNDCPLRAIRDIADGKMIGSATLSPPFEDETDWTLGISLLPSARGKGLATKALKVLVDYYAIDILAIKRVAARVKVENMASRRVLEACGLELIDVYPKSHNPIPFEKYDGEIARYQKDLEPGPGDVDK